MSNHFACFYSLCARGDAKKVLISALAVKFNLPKMTLWKRITGQVIGKGHHSRGRGLPKVLSSGKFQNF